jgi:hypothetical protein
MRLLIPIKQSSVVQAVADATAAAQAQRRSGLQPKNQYKLPSRRQSMLA